MEGEGPNDPQPSGVASTRFSVQKVAMWSLWLVISLVLSHPLLENKSPFSPALPEAFCQQSRSPS